MRMNNLAMFDPLVKTTVTAGTPVKLSPYLVGTTVAFNNNSGTPPTAATSDTITDSGNGFVTAGFKDGDKVKISGSTSNDGIYTVTTVAAGTLTLNISGTLTTEIAGDTVTVERISGYGIAPGVKVIIRALPDNTGTVYLAPTAARALSSASGYYRNSQLQANQYIGIQIINLDSIWLDSSVNGEGVEILIEK